MTADHEIGVGSRFGFGANWARFLSVLDEQRIEEAVASLRESLQVEDLNGKHFLDIGSGSGLSSLAARRLGAAVTSFDFDPQSVACTQELKRRYFPDDPAWRVEQGSVLDRQYIESLGEFDVVYSWGVLHHTGAMWLGIENAISRVARPAGKLFIAIYNDQGWKSHLWWLIKSLYNKLPRFLRKPMIIFVSAISRCLVILKYTLMLKPMVAIKPLLDDKRERGMSATYDRADWVGGFPYEFVTFDTLKAYLESRGFSLTYRKRNTSLGCHELVVQRAVCAD